MEDNDGSSKAAQSAPSKSVANFNFSEKLMGLFSRKKTDNISETNDEIQENKISTVSHGMFNLRRLCVEDVAIPKAEIVSVSADIKKSELVSVFRESGLTRLPVYEGLWIIQLEWFILKILLWDMPLRRKILLKLKIFYVRYYLFPHR